MRSGIVLCFDAWISRGFIPGRKIAPRESVGAGVAVWILTRLVEVGPTPSDGESLGHVARGRAVGSGYFSRGGTPP